METPPPLSGQSVIDRDAGNLKLLSIFYFIFAGLAIVGILFLVAHFMVMQAMMNNHGMWQNQRNTNVDPEMIMGILKWFYLFGGLMCITGGILNLLSGLFIRARKHRVFSIVVAALNCLQFPLGTALGVWTIVVLLRDSVKQAYDSPAIPITQATFNPEQR